MRLALPMIPTAVVVGWCLTPKRQDTGASTDCFGLFGRSTLYAMSVHYPECLSLCLRTMHVLREQAALSRNTWKVTYLTDVEGHWPYFCNFAPPATLESMFTCIACCLACQVDLSEGLAFAEEGVRD